jgi:hypothetical protein
MTLKQNQIMFYSAALFNWSAAIVLLPGLGIDSFIGIQPLLVGSPFEYLLCMSIALFGLGYWWAGQGRARGQPEYRQAGDDRQALVGGDCLHLFFSG